MKALFRIVFILLFCNYVHALTDAEIKAKFTKIVMKCMQNFSNLNMNEVIALQRLETPKSIKTKCLLACAYKVEGAMTDKGLYDIEHAYEVAELAKNGDEKRLEAGKKIAEICAKVNESAVSDGEKGCERAGMIFKCVGENARKFGFKV